MLGFHPGTGEQFLLDELHGNLPQAFVHAIMLDEASVRIAQAQ